MQQSEWVFAYASAIGNGHISGNLPCQDYCDVRHYDSFSIGIVSDGAGSCSNSHLGAQKVCEYAMHYFSDALKQKEWIINNTLPCQEEWNTLARQTLLQVRNDLAQFAYNSEVELKSLSCTIIVVIILKKGLLVTHIGDGRAGYCNQQNEWFPMITPFHGEEANETVFITSDIWYSSIIDRYIESNIIDEEIKAFSLLSDGCEKASFECNLYDEEKSVFYDPNRPFKHFYDKNVNVHLPLLKKAGKNQDEINILWKKFLTDGNVKLQIEPDDKTMILGVYVTPVEELYNATTGTT